MRSTTLAALFALSGLAASPRAAERILDPALHHLRNAPAREWADFPENPEAAQLTIRFNASPNPNEQTLRLRHRDVKLTWKISLNGKEIARLPQDEREMITYWSIPPAAMKQGPNDLTISCLPGPADDVSIGELKLIDLPKSEVLAESQLNVAVTDESTGKPLPCRISITTPQGIPIELEADPAPHLAIRPGVAYTATGRVAIRLPAGRYIVHAGRGFEYGIASKSIETRAGAPATLALSIRREVDTTGYVAADTHVHSATYARHGDATILERLVTLAGEGIELPVSTEHNMLVDLESHAQQAGVREFLTPVLGSEVTTPAIGHFNVFPFVPGAKPVNQRLPRWEQLADAFKEVSPHPIVILNHARDVHGGFRPLDPRRHVSLAGEDLDGWTLPANAMEVLNSGAVLSDPLLLVRDWMGLLNRGIRLTPIGSSDSHDVTRYIVGQGRSYVQCDDTQPNQIDIPKTVDSFRKGNVSVSYGLLTELKVSDLQNVHIRVQGPAWTTASRVILFANGIAIHEAAIPPEIGSRPGLKWEGTWKLDGLKHDVHLVAVAMGPGVTQAYWPTSKPYQPTGIEFTPYVMGISGATFVDLDRSGRFESAYDYARRLVDLNPNDPSALGKALSGYDAGVAVQAASVMRARRPASFQADARLMGASTSKLSADAIDAYVKSVSIIPVP